MERQDVVNLLNKMAALYPTFKPDKPSMTIDAWLEILGDIDADVINKALTVYARTVPSKYAPSPSELLSTITNTVDVVNGQNGAEAWTMVSKAIRNSAYNSEAEFAKFPPLVQKAVGSAGQLRVWALDESYNEGVAKSLFERSYKVEVERAKTIALMPGDLLALTSDALKQLGVNDDQ